MAHTAGEKTKLLNSSAPHPRPDGSNRTPLDEEKGCSRVLQLIAGVRGAVNGLMAEVLEDHIHLHVADPALASDHRSEGGRNSSTSCVPT